MLMSISQRSAPEDSKLVVVLVPDCLGNRFPRCKPIKFSKQSK